MENNQMDLYQSVMEQIENFIKINKLRYEDVSQKTGISKSALSKYISGDSKPSLKFVYNFCREYGVPIESIFKSCDSRPISLSENAPSVSNPGISRFIGNYLIYYFKTNNNSYDKSSEHNIIDDMDNGIIRIEEVRGTIKVTAIVNFLSLDNAYNALTALNCSQKNMQEIYDDASNNNEQVYLYNGNLNFIDENIQLLLYGKDVADNVCILLMNPRSKREYIGGVGIMASASRGRHKIPCIQKLLLSRYPISLETNQDKDTHALENIRTIENLLKLNSKESIKSYKENLNISSFSKDICKYIQYTYKESLAQNKEFDSEYLLQTYIESQLKLFSYNYLENRFSFTSKINEGEDEQAYYMLKKQLNKNSLQ